MSVAKREFVSPLLSPKEAAAMTTLSRPCLAMMAAEGQFPKAILIGERRLAYVRQEVVEWIADKMAHARVG